MRTPVNRNWLISREKRPKNRSVCINAVTNWEIRWCAPVYTTIMYLHQGLHSGFISNSYVQRWAKLQVFESYVRASVYQQLNGFCSAHWGCKIYWSSSLNIARIQLGALRVNQLKNFVFKFRAFFSMLHHIPITNKFCLAVQSKFFSLTMQQLSGCLVNKYSGLGRSERFYDKF